MTSTGKWREDQILVICPGSSTTMAQLGVAELTPPTHRFPTRMFRDDESNDWRPYHTFKRKKSRPAVAVEGSSAPDTEEGEWEYVEDPDSTEGAVYPMQAGKIVHMDAFLAFLDHVHSMLTTTYHNTPIMLMASPQWTNYDSEAIARYIFEKTKTPALCLIHSGIATQYGMRHGNMTVVDIGLEKVDVTCVHDSRVVNQLSTGSGIEGSADEDISGGEVFTRRLMELLKSQNFTHEMAEQLKKSPICEVLPYAPDLPGLMELPKQDASAATTAPAPAPGQPGGPPENLSNAEPLKPAAAHGDDGAYQGDDAAGENDGVLDVASIVTSGNTKEFIAKKEKEKAERAKRGKGAKNQEAEANKHVRLPNSKRVRSIFHFEEYVTEDKTRPADSAAKEQEQKQKQQDAAFVTPPASREALKVAGEVEPKPQTDASNPEQAAASSSAASAESSAPKADEPVSLIPSGDPLATPATHPVLPEPEPRVKRARRDIEIGLERFTFAERDYIDRIATTIYRAVQGIELMYMRPACWDNIVFVGNGSKIRGLKENIIQTLTARHLISPSTATIFTSELPSNLATPSGTGSQTPTSQFAGAPHQLPNQSSGVNPLLQAATTASLALPRSDSTSNFPGAPGSAAGDIHPPAQSHHFHSQTPTSIKLATFPTYLSEWTKNGFEESMFLGSLVAARLAYCVHNLDMSGLDAQRMMSLSRIEYNEHGPKAIRTHSMLG